jgi:hypothetical protein
MASEEKPQIAMELLCPGGATAQLRAAALRAKFKKPGDKTDDLLVDPTRVIGLEVFRVRLSHYSTLFINSRNGAAVR